MTKLKVEHWETSRLIDYARNPRKNDAVIPKMIASIKEFGFRIPIIAKSDGTVVDGHLRLKAARQLGLEFVPVALADELTETQIKAFRLLANQSANWAEWDEDLLKLEIDDLKIEGFDVDLIGFDFELEDSPVELNGDPDEVPEPPSEAKTKRGDLWILGQHRLLCGDSTDINDVEKLMDGEKADIAFTSPPYNAGTTPTEHKGNKKSKYKNDTDDKTTDEYCSFLKSFTLISLKFSDYSFVNLQSLANNKISLIDYLYNLKDFYADTIIWDKQNTQPAMARNVLNSVFEYVHVFSKKSNRAIGAKDFRGTLNNIIHIPQQRKNEWHEIHNATFPLEFSNYFVNNFSLNSVLDLFGGSGTTLVACEQLNRKCYMMELDESYCDVIIQRWQELTGKEAIHAETGKKYNDL